MNDFIIDIASGSYYFVIENIKYDLIPDYQKKLFYYGYDEGECSYLAIYTDIKTCEILAIVCVRKNNAMEVPFLCDWNEYADLKKKANASYITPKGAGNNTFDFIDDFAVYFSKEMMRVIFDDEVEPCFFYTDGRITVYYDADYNLLDIIIKDLTSEEYESLRNKRFK